MLLFLIGYRGTGKTTVAALLGKTLGLDWLDADDQLQRSCGMTIKEIFEQEGEASFRDRESDVLEKLAHRDQLVAALGGGVILREANRRQLKRGTVIWLTADAATLFSRIAQDPATSAQRPNLTVGGLAEITELLSAREPVYRACADITINTHGKTPEEVAAEIAGQISGESNA